MSKSKVKRHLKQYIIFVFAVILHWSAYAQEDIYFANSQINHQFYNPALSGTKNYLEAALTYRKQWVNIEGAPSTALLLVNTPIPGKKLGLGAMIYNNKLGMQNNNGFLLNCSYKFSVSDRSTLSMGIQAGIIYKQMRWTELTQFDPSFKGVDPAFPIQNNSVLTPNFGVGVYYYTKTFGIGIAVPRLLSNNLPNNESFSKNFTFDADNIPFYIQTNMFFPINKNWSIVPMAMLKYNTKSIVQLNCNIINSSGIMIGTGYNTTQLLSGTVGYRVNQNLKVIYTYQHNINNNYGRNLNNHEITLNYNIAVQKKQYTSPRYF